MKKASVLIFAIICLATGAKAQESETAVGAKFYTGNGSLGGLNIRYSPRLNTALEGSLLFFSGGLGIEGLYEYQAPIAGADGLKYFVGGGGMLGFGTGKGSQTAFALRLTGGLDYKFEDAPIDVSLGFDPFFYLAPSTGSNLALGIGLRYVIK
ncbi:MAG: hypothetical protein ABI416_08800 [Ginsengibacter sp.]